MSEIESLAACSISTCRYRKVADDSRFAKAKCMGRIRADDEKWQAEKRRHNEQRKRKRANDTNTDIK